MQSELGKKLVGDKNPNYGNKWSEEKKKALSDKFSSGVRKGVNNANYGNRWSKKQRDSLRNKNSKKVYLIYEGGKLVNVLRGSGRVAEFYKIGRSGISGLKVGQIRNTKSGLTIKVKS